MATQTFTAFTPEIWSPRVNDFFRANLVTAPFFLDYSDDVAQGGDIIHIPNITEGFSASSIPVTSGSLTATNLSDTNTNLTVDSWEGASYDLTDFQFAQVLRSYNIKDMYARSLAYTLAKKFDSDLMAEASSVTPVVGDSGTSILATSIEKAIGILSSNSVPMTDLTFFFHPTVYWNEVMSIQKYYDASQFGKATVPFGAHDMLYGIPVVLTEQVKDGTAGTEGGHRNLLIHRSALMYAFGSLANGQSRGVRLQEKSSENLKVIVVGDIIYGTGLLNAKRGVRIISTN